MNLIFPLVDEIKHNTKIFNKLLKTEYEYYCVYIFCNILKYFAYFKASQRNGKISRVFNYLNEVEGFLSEEEIDLVKLAIILSRKSNRLKENYRIIDLEKLKSILDKIHLELNLDIN